VALPESTRTPFSASNSHCSQTPPSWRPAVVAGGFMLISECVEMRETVCRAHRAHVPIRPSTFAVFLGSFLWPPQQRSPANRVWSSRFPRAWERTSFGRYVPEIIGQPSRVEPGAPAGVHTLLTSSSKVSMKLGEQSPAQPPKSSAREHLQVLLTKRAGLNLPIGPWNRPILFRY
jgi:hypothetical protein